MARGSPMHIEKIYVYPIKSCRGIELPSATLTKHGFPYDRIFMLLHHAENKKTGEKEWKNMSVSGYPEMVRFSPSFNQDDASITVTYHPVDPNEDSKTIDIPLEPETEGLEEVDVVMHLSPTKAYKMPEKFNTFLSSCFGYEVLLAYISDNLREVRMSSEKYKGQQPFLSEQQQQQPSTTGWLSSLASKATNFLTGSETPEISAIRFSDVAPYLLVSSKSIQDINSRLPAEERSYDITKFRPNIIVSGAEAPWEEDFWGEITISSPSGETKLALEHNCGRCASINVDYNTGAPGKGEAGTMLKKLMKDRRVDVGAKWSPIFGRYGFLEPGSEGVEIKVGEEVRVSRVNEERTAFDWKGLSTLKGGGRD